MKYTAEEVRKSANWLYQWERDWLYQWERKAGVRNVRAMLIAYAERIEADEGAVPFGYAYRYADGIKLGGSGRERNGMRPTETIPLFTHPPAQAAQGETSCPKCGATNPEDAATRCFPDGDSCPGCEEPLAQAWDRKAAQPAQSVSVAKVRRVAADIRHWNEAICHPALNVFADELEAALQEKSP